MEKKDRNKQQKRTSLLDTAFRLFTSRGIHNTSISDIVEDAGVAKGTFYLYFKDKYDIRNKLVVHKAAEVFRKADAALAWADFSAFSGNTVYEEKVLFLIDNIIGQFTRDKTLLEFISKRLSWGLMMNILTEPESERENGYNLYQSVLQGKTDLYESPEIMLYMIIELVSSVCFSSIISGEPAEIDTMKPYLFRTVRQIMRAHQKGEIENGT